MLHKSDCSLIDKNVRRPLIEGRNFESDQTKHVWILKNLYVRIPTVMFDDKRYYRKQSWTFRSNHKRVTLVPRCKGWEGQMAVASL